MMAVDEGNYGAVSGGTAGTRRLWWKYCMPRMQQMSALIVDLKGHE